MDWAVVSDGVPCAGHGHGLGVPWQPIQPPIPRLGHWVTDRRLLQHVRNLSVTSSMEKNGTCFCSSAGWGSSYEAVPHWFGDCRSQEFEDGEIGYKNSLRFGNLLALAKCRACKWLFSNREEPEISMEHPGANLSSHHAAKADTAQTQAMISPTQFVL